MASQADCTAFQNVPAVLSACASAGCTAKPIAATMAQTVARMIPPWQVNSTPQYSSAHGRGSMIATGNVVPKKAQGAQKSLVGAARFELATPSPPGRGDP